MRVFPDKGLTVCMVLLAGLSGGLLASPFWSNALIAACLVTVALLVKDYLWLRRHGRDVSASIATPASCQRGEPIEAVVRVSNIGRARVAVSVRPLLPEQGRPGTWGESVRLEGTTEARLPCVIQTPVRGAYAFGDLYLRVSGPGRMLRMQQRLAHESVCKVYPNVKRVHEYIISRRAHVMNAPHVRRTALRGLGSEFEGLRDYENGDDIRRIDWRATAKHRKPITREYEIESMRNVLVIVDRGRLMASDASRRRDAGGACVPAGGACVPAGGACEDAVGMGTKLDCAIDSALMLCAVALDSGDRAGVLVFGKDVCAYVPPRGAVGSLPRIVEAVYAVQPVLDESDFLSAFAQIQSRLHKRSMIVVLTDVIDADASRSLMEGALALNKRHLVIVAALKTPAIQDVIEPVALETTSAPKPPLRDPMGPFRKAAAYRLVKERRDVMSRLRKGGVHVLDVAPDELTVPLVNKYVELREQNRL